MKKLSQFLAEHILNRKDFTDEEYADILQHYTEDLHDGIVAYQKYLKDDNCATVQWKMIEAQIIIALTRAEKGDV